MLVILFLVSAVAVFALTVAWGLARDRSDRA